MRNYIRSTTTTTGLTVKAFLVDRAFQKGRKVSKEQRQRRPTVRNYMIANTDILHPNRYLICGQLLRGTKGNGSFFLSTKGHEERQLQNGNCNFFLSTKGREGARRTATAERQRQLLFVHEGSRRGTKNGNCNFFLSTKGRGEHSFVVAADHDCRTGDLGEEGAGSACRRHELA